MSDDILFTHVPSSKEMKEKEECKEKKGWKTCRKGYKEKGIRRVNCCREKMTLLGENERTKVDLQCEHSVSLLSLSFPHPSSLLLLPLLSNDAMKVSRSLYPIAPPRVSSRSFPSSVCLQEKMKGKE